MKIPFRKIYIKSLATTVFCALFTFSLWISVSEAKIVERILAIVNDEVVTMTELNERLAKNKDMMRQIFRYDEKRLSEEIEKARPEVLQTMVDELLFTQEAIKTGITVSDAEVQQFANALRDQYESSEAFREALRAEGYTVESFKKEKRKTLILQRLIEQKFGSELNISDQEVSEFYEEHKDEMPSRSDSVKLKHIFINFEITKEDRNTALVRARRLLKRLKEGADFGEIAATFSDHEPTKQLKGDMGYFVPGMGIYDEQLEMTASNLAAGEISDLLESPGGYDIIKVTDKKDNEIRLQRIFIAIWPSPSAEEAAMQKAESILQELRGGASFVALAKKYSDDPLAKEKNGDWRDTPIDAMSPNLRAAFDSLEEGQISRPVKTPFGYHIFRIVKRQALTDDEIEQLREIIRQERLRDKLSEYSGKLRKEAYIQILVED